MHKIDRRKLMASGAIGAAAVTLGLAAPASPKTVSSDDKLSDIIRRYRAEIAAINASHDLTDDELDEWVDRADAMIQEAFRLPVLKAASAVAVIDLLIAEDLIASHRLNGGDWVALTKSTRDYIASTAT